MDRQTDWETHSWRCWWHLEQSHFSSGRFAGRAGNGLFLSGSEHGTSQRRRCLQPPADNAGLLFLRQAPKGGLPGAEPPIQPRGPSEGGPFVMCPKAPDGLRQAVPARISHLHEELEGP